MTIITNESPRVKVCHRYAFWFLRRPESKTDDMSNGGVTALLVIAMAVCVACDLSTAPKLM